MLESYVKDDARDVWAALRELFPRTGWAWAPAGIYCYWQPENREVLYLGLATDLAQRFAQHNGLVRFTDHDGSYRALGWSNTLLVVCILAFAAQLALSRAEVRYTREDATLAITDLLEVAARAIAHPLDWSSIQIRAHCYKYDPAKDRLVPIAHCSSHEHSDNWTPIPCDARHEKRFVIVKSVRAGTDLNEEFRGRSDLEREVGVWKDLHTVLAAPIRVMGDETKVIGIVNFDSSLYEKRYSFR